LVCVLVFWVCVCGVCGCVFFVCVCVVCVCVWCVWVCMCVCVCESECVYVCVCVCTCMCGQHAESIMIEHVVPTFHSQTKCTPVSGTESHTHTCW